MRELLIEVFAAMKGNRMRIALTGFSIGWGIFILIVLISSGRGLINGMYYNFREYNVGMVTVTPGLTSQPFEGRSQGRTVHLYEEDAAALQQLLGDTVCAGLLWRGICQHGGRWLCVGLCHSS